MGGFLDTIFGHPERPSKEAIAALRAILSRMQQMNSERFGEGAFQRRNGLLTEQTDRDFQNRQSSGVLDLGDRGFSGMPEGLGAARDSFVAKQGLDLRNQMSDEEMQALLAQLGVIGPLGDMTKKAASPGLFQTAASIYGASQGIPMKVPGQQQAQTANPFAGDNTYTSGGGAPAPGGNSYADFMNGMDSKEPMSFTQSASQPLDLSQPPAFPPRRRRYSGLPGTTQRYGGRGY